MIPISDDNPAKTPPIVNWAIIALCVGVFLWELSLGENGVDRIGVSLGFSPSSLTYPNSAASHAYGIPPAVTVLTSMFLHGSILHIAGNMLYLWIFGNNVEEAMGHVKYLLFYLLSGLGAAAGFYFMEPSSDMPMIGASGAISGVLAAYVLLFPRNKVTVIIPLGIIFYPIAISAVWVVGAWFVLQLISAAFSDPSQPGTAWWAHVGGFAMGAVLTPFLKSREFPLFGRTPQQGPWN